MKLFKLANNIPFIWVYRWSSIWISLLKNPERALAPFIGYQKELYLKIKENSTVKYMNYVLKKVTYCWTAIRFLPQLPRRIRLFYKIDFSSVNINFVDKLYVGFTCKFELRHEIMYKTHFFSYFKI